MFACLLLFNLQSVTVVGCPIYIIETNAFGKLGALARKVKNKFSAKSRLVGDSSDSKESHDAAIKEQTETERSNMLVSGVQKIVHFIEDLRDKHDKDKEDEENSSNQIFIFYLIILLLISI